MEKIIGNQDWTKVIIKAFANDDIYLKLMEMGCVIR